MKGNRLGLMEVCETINNETGKRSYYIKKCDVFQKVSKQDFEGKLAQCDGYSSFFTKTKGKYTRHYKTLTFWY